MKLRRLEEKDATAMLEWMHDEDVIEYMQNDFMSKTLEDCKAFINDSYGKHNIHLAIVNDFDEYMGTVSLKNIHNNMAEFAITIRRCAMGKGVSKFGMSKIVEIGIKKLHLKMIYWCVSPENKRAVKFYDKNGYDRIEPYNIYDIKKYYTSEQIEHYLWYEVKTE